MKKSVLLLLLISLSPFSTAFDAVGKIKRERPAMLDTANAVLSSSRMVKASYQLEGSAEMKQVPLNKIHQWVLTLTKIDNVPIKGISVEVYPDMPEHLHGMSTQPLAREGDKPGEYIIEGMNFHMPGWWVVTLDISKGGMRDLVRFNVIVGEGEDKKTMHHQHH